MLGQCEQLSEFKNSLNTVNNACDEVQKSVKLKEILRRILYLENTLNQGTIGGKNYKIEYCILCMFRIRLSKNFAGLVVGLKLDNLSKLTYTRSSDSKMTLMHYLCKVLASKSPALLDFYVDLVSLKSATKVHIHTFSHILISGYC
ncbi:putative formin, FH2 domain-containing protein [Helianthus anomalus]